MLWQYCLARHCNTCVYQLGLISKTCTIISSIYQVFQDVHVHPITQYSVHTTILYLDVFECIVLGCVLQKNVKQSRN